MSGCADDPQTHIVYLIAPGPRPFFADVAYHLWGTDCDFDSDGNDDAPAEGGWTELTVSLRPDQTERVDIDPLDDERPLVLVIRSERLELVRCVAEFLHSESGGQLSHMPPAGRELTTVKAPAPPPPNR